MSTFYVYSIEPMPRVDLFSKRDYNPSTDYIAYNGIYLEAIPAKTWVKIPDRFRSLRHRDRTDKAGTPYHVFADEIVKANQERLRARGVVFTEAEPSADEKAKLEAEAEKLNLAYRLSCIQEYEEAIQRANATQTSPPLCLSYTRECYDILGMERPGSVEALRAQRQPGEASADRIANAIEKALSRLLGAAKEGQASATPTPAAGKPAPVRTI